MNASRAAFLLAFLCWARPASAQSTFAKRQEALRSWEQLAPSERARILRNYARWRAMSPEDRARIRDHFSQFQRGGPETRESLIRAWEHFRVLSAPAPVRPAPPPLKVPIPPPHR